jgi:hypothetical protein
MRYDESMFHGVRQGLTFINIGHAPGYQHTAILLRVWRLVVFWWWDRIRGIPTSHWKVDWSFKPLKKKSPKEG